MSTTPTRTSTTAARPRRLPRLRRWTGRGLVAMVALALVGAVLQLVAERRDAAAHPPPGELVTLADGRALHLDVQGAEHDGPVVVLETGMGGSSAAWGWIQPMLADHVTVVSYDRPGLGWSDASDAGPQPDNVVADLRHALEAAGLAGRGYVLVGHSLGGHYVRWFAQQHPDEVVGMVLVDPSHERQAQEIDGLDEDMRQAAMMIRAVRAASRLGLTRLYDPFAAVVADLPEPQLSQALAAQVTPAYFDAYLAELAAMDAIGAQLAAGTTELGDLPLAVLIADAAPNEAAQATVDHMARLRAELGVLSTRSTVEVIGEAQHVTIVTDRTHARIVADHVLELIAQADPVAAQGPHLS